MKKLKQKRMRKILFLGIAILSLVFAINFITAPEKAAGLTIAAGFIVGGVELSEAEEKSYKAMMGEVEKTVEKQIKGYITDTKATELINEALANYMKSGVPIDIKTITGLQAQLDRLGTAVIGLQEKGLANNKESIKSLVRKSFTKEICEEIIKAYKGGHTVNIFEHKVVGTISTGAATTDTGGNAILDYINADSVEGIRLAEPFIEQFATVSSTSKAVYTYADWIPKDGDVNFLAESGTKTQVDLKLETRSLSPKKAAGYEVLTEEAITDIPRMQAMASDILLKKYLLRRQHGILFGDGTSDTPLGVTALATVWNSASWTGTKIVNPNLLDVIRAITNQILTSYNWTDDVEYMPNVVLLNPADWFAFIGTKNTQEMYVFPQFSIATPNGNKVVDNLTVVVKNKIPQGKIIVGDFTKLEIINYVPYSVRMGWINDQFIKNQFTMLGEGRFFTLIKNYNRRAFVYDDISDVVAGITA